MAGSARGAAIWTKSAYHALHGLPYLSDVGRLGAAIGRSRGEYRAATGVEPLGTGEGRGGRHSHDRAAA